MGKIFVEHMGGVTLFDCAVCRTNLSNLDQLVRMNIINNTPGNQVYLFNKVVNITLSKSSDQFMLSAYHKVGYIFCKVCNSRLGLCYDHVTEESERYKEGKFIIESSMISKSCGIKNEK